MSRRGATTGSSDQQASYTSAPVARSVFKSLPKGRISAGMAAICASPIWLIDAQRDYLTL
jgi:hypothetical protein